MMKAWLLWGQLSNSLQLWVDRVSYELEVMDSYTSSSLKVFCWTVFLVAMVSVFYSWRLGRLLAAADGLLEKVNEHIDARQARQAYLLYLLRLTRSAGDSMNMALYMSEMRRKSKIRRPPRPKELKDRAPELLPGLRAERCVKDGIAVLDIEENDNIFEAAYSNKNHDVSSVEKQFKTSFPGGEACDTACSKTKSSIPRGLITTLK